MSAIDPGRLERTARRLTAVATATHSELADARLDRLWTWAVRLARNLEAAFAAVQMLRDLETIDRAEAAYLLRELLEYQIWMEMYNRDPELDRAVQDGLDHELLMAAMHEREAERAATFHRDHGEDALAEMLLHEADAYAALCADGQLSLIDDKPSSDETTRPVSPPDPAHPLFERVLALSATETIKEWVPAWRGLCDALTQAEPSTAVAAIQSVRDIGGISFDESLVLIDMAISALVDDARQFDRESHRLERAIEELNRQHGIDEGDGAADETRPFAWRVLQHRRIRRIEGLTAVVLRRFGEHRMATLQVIKPEEYARICDEIAIGVRP